MPAIRTNDGRLVDPFHPKPEDVRPRVMLHSISMLNRFTGQSNYPYSVGQHTRNLYRVVPRSLRRAALIHDLSESWFNDIASPVKAHRSLQGYKREEHKAKMFIGEVLEVSAEELDALDYFDKKIYINERNALFTRIDVVGMGDDRVGLNNLPACLLVETDWRLIRAELNGAFIREFGEEVFER